jgi:hypothetical protein
MNKRYKIEQDGFSCIVRDLQELVEELIPAFYSNIPFEIYEEINGEWELIRSLRIVG